MNDIEYSHILDQVSRWSFLGERNAGNGTRLIGHVPHVGREAYLHSVYPGLSDSQIAELQVLVKRDIPPAYRSFLKLGNGISLFLKLSLDGLRSSYTRDADSSRQPFHLQDANVWERPQNADPQAVFIGGYSYDGSKLYMLPHGDRVYHCSRRDAKPTLNTWRNINTLLESEIARLAELFDARGRLVHADKPTSPQAGTYLS